MAGNSSDPDAPRTASRTKDAIIGAIATVLAAVIGAAGLIITNERRDATVLRNRVEKLEGDLHAKAAEVKRLSSIEEGRPQEPSVAVALTSDDQLNLPVIQTERDLEYTFGLQGCARTGSSTTCYVRVSNEGPERRLEVYANPNRSFTTRMIDQFGKQRYAEVAVIAGVEGEDPAVDIPTGVSVPALVRVKDVPPDVSKFAVLDLAFKSPDRLYERKVTFRDVTIKSAIR